MSNLTPYLNLTQQDNEYQYKKTLGVSDKYPGSSSAQEPLNSSPYVYNSQIMSNTIPSTAPNLDVSTNISGGGYRYNTIGNNYIFNYQYLPLKTIGYQNSSSYIFSYTYKSATTDPSYNISDPSYNFAMQSISSKYDSVNATYAISVYAKKSGFDPKLNTSYVAVSSGSSDMPWIFDNTTGYITFTKQAWNYIYNTNTNFDDFPYINFYRYEGPFGINSGVSSQWTTLNNNIFYDTGNVGIGITNPAYKLDVNGNTRVTGGITGSTGSFTYLSASQQMLTPAGITGSTGSFTYLSASKQMLTPAGITGSTGSFTYLYASQQMLTPAGITGSTGSFTYLSASQQMLTPAGITGSTGSFTYLSASQQMLTPAGITGSTGSFTYLSASQGITGTNASFTTLSASQQILAPAGITGSTGSFNYLYSKDNTYLASSSGKVVIGTANNDSGNKLHVNGRTTIYEPTGNNGCLSFISVNNINYIQTGSGLTGGSSTPLLFTDIFYNNSPNFLMKIDTDSNITAKQFTASTKLSTSNLSAITTSSSQNIYTDLTTGGSLNIGSFSSTCTIYSSTTFSSIPVCSTSASSANQLVNYTTLTGQGYTTLASVQANNNVWTGTNSFNTSLPTSTVTPSLPSQLITKTYADGTFIDFTTNQTISGTKRFGAIFTTGTDYTNILGGGGDRLSIYMSSSGNILQFAPVTNSNTYRFFSKNNIGDQIVSLETNYDTTTINNSLVLNAQATFNNICPISNTNASLSNHLTTLGFNNGKYIDFTTDQTISGTKQFSTVAWTNNGKVFASSITGDYLNFSSFFDLNNYAFYTRDSLSQSSISFQISSSSTSVSNQFYSTNNTYLATQSGTRVGIGKTTASYTLDISGNMRINQDCLINDITLGYGGGKSNTNTVLGYNALAINTTGIQNIGIGYSVLNLNTSGSNNLAIGYNSLYNNTSATDNIALGNNAIYRNNTGCYNIGIGSYSGYNNTTGQYNIGIGQQTLYYGVSNHRIAIGSYAGYSNGKTGAIAIGSYAGYTGQGQYSVAIGYYAGYSDISQNSIIINATGSELNGTTSNSTYISPIRGINQDISSGILIYNKYTKELTYSTSSQLSIPGGITGSTGSFTYLSASQQILTPAGISGSTGSFTYLFASQGITGPTGSFTYLSASQGITGTNASFTTLSASQQILTPAGISGSTGSFTYLFASQGITGPTGSFNYLSATNNTYLATQSGTKVGIGKTTPGYTLDVSGDIIGNDISARGSFAMKNLDSLRSDTAGCYLTGNSYTFVGNFVNNNYIFNTKSSNLSVYKDAVVIKYDNTVLNNNVGIGKTPSYTLDVSGSLRTTGEIQFNPDTGTSNATFIQVMDSVRLSFSPYGNRTDMYTGTDSFYIYPTGYNKELRIYHKNSSGDESQTLTTKYGSVDVSGILVSREIGTKGITGTNASFTTLSASQGITGPTGSFTYLSASQGITGTNASFTTLSVSQGITGSTGSFKYLSASQGITGSTGSFTYLSASQYVNSNTYNLESTTGSKNLFTNGITGCNINFGSASSTNSFSGLSTFTDNITINNSYLPKLTIKTTSTEYTDIRQNQSILQFLNFSNNNSGQIAFYFNNTEKVYIGTDGIYTTPGCSVQTEKIEPINGSLIINSNTGTTNINGKTTFSGQILAQEGTTGSTGSFTYLSASQKILTPAGITGSTGSFSYLSSSQGITGSTGSFSYLSTSQGITGSTGSFSYLSASQGITGSTGSFSYLSASQGITGSTGSFSNVTASNKLSTSNLSAITTSSSQNIYTDLTTGGSLNIGSSSSTCNINSTTTFSNNCNFSGSLLSRTNMRLYEWKNQTDNTITLNFPMERTIALRTSSGTNMILNLPKISANERGMIFTFIKLTNNTNVTINTTGGDYIYTLNNLTLQTTTNTTLLSTNNITTTLAVGFFETSTYWIEVSNYSTYDRDYNNIIYARLATANVFTSTNTFNSYLPTSTLTPSEATQLITKTYADGNFMFKTGSVTENITGEKTFQNSTFFSGNNGYFMINPNMSGGAYNPASTTGTIGIIGLKDQTNDNFLLTLYGSIHASVKLNFSSVSMGFGGGSQIANTSVICNGTNVVIKPSLKFDGDNTIQNSAFTGAGSLNGTYNLANMTIDTNGKITALSSGLSSTNIWTGTNNFNGQSTFTTLSASQGITGPTGSFTYLSSTSNTYLASSSGNVGIGTSNTNTNNKLHVSGRTTIYGQSIDGNGCLSFTSDNTNNYIQTGLSLTTGSSAPLIFTDIYNSNSPNFLMKIDTNSNVTATKFIATSDYRVKENIEPLDNTFKVDNLKPVKYNLKSSKKISTGFIAHELQEEFPFLVHGEKDGKDIQAIDYLGLISILVKEIQDLKKEVSNMKVEFLKINK